MLPVPATYGEPPQKFPVPPPDPPGKPAFEVGDAPPPPPPALVIVEKTEFDPGVPVLFVHDPGAIGPPAPPPPTVIG